VWNLNGSLSDNLRFFGLDDIFGVNFTCGEHVALCTVNWAGEWEYKAFAGKSGVSKYPFGLASKGASKFCR